MNTRFASQVVIVTGASSGLGLATARAFAREGADLVLASRDVARLQDAATEINQLTGRTPLVVACDVTRRPEVDDLVARALAHFQRIDVLVNNAGSGMVAPFEFVQFEDARSLFEVNFFGALHCIQAVVPHLQRQGHGRVVNIASIGGLRGIPNISIYSASKAALIGLSDSLRLELRRQGIRVTVVCPGRMSDTRFFERLKRYGPLKLYEMLEAVPTDTVARALVDAAYHGRSMVILPLKARLWHLICRMLPGYADRVLYRNMPRLEKDPTAG